MYSVNLEMSREEIEACLMVSHEAEKTAMDWLALIRVNILALEGAMPYVHTVVAPSLTKDNVEYKVTRITLRSDTTYSCSCPAFQFGKGLDSSGYCKHIRRSECYPYAWKLESRG